MDKHILLPEYPTQAMRDAGNKALDMLKTEPGMGIADRAYYVYCAMVEEYLAAAPAPAAQKLPPPELTWLYGHCKAIGMDCKSDSGKWEEDIALFTVNLQDEIRKLKAAPAAQDEREGKTEQQAEPVAYMLKTGHGTGVRLRISNLDPEVQKMWQPLYAHPPAQQDAAQLEKQNAELLKDAERYRWLRGEHCLNILQMCMCMYAATNWKEGENKLDRAIDAALASSQGEHRNE